MSNVMRCEKIEPVRDVDDLLIFIAEHDSKSDVELGISYKRTRNYSRIQAIKNKNELDTITEVCQGKFKSKEVQDYLKNKKLCRKKKIMVYRGGGDIRPGDWVALEYKYALTHGEPVYCAELSPEDIRWAGRYEKEWYYIPAEMDYSLDELWKEAILKYGKSKIEEKARKIYESISQRLKETR